MRAYAVLFVLPVLGMLATPVAITPTFTVNAAPSTLTNYNNAGEPSIGVDWNTNQIMFQAYSSTYKFDPVTSTWLKVTPPSSIFNIDPILFTDSKTGRTFAGGLDGTCSVLSYTDNDGALWVPMSNTCAGAGWDHETIGGGVFAAPQVGVGYSDIVYYCSQTGLTPGPAWCSTSNDGGVSFNGGTATWTTQCGGLHGHIKVGPDGYAYLPNAVCGSVQGVAVSANNGVTWTLNTVPSISKTDQFDPSVAVGGTATNQTVYFCGRDGSGHAKVATSTNHGTSWSTAVDVAPTLANIEFPAMVAGDSDKAACAFLGTTTSGDTQKSTFNGVWHLYIAYTWNRGSTWTLVDATGSDPVQRGCIWASGGSNACRNLLDFMDAQLTKDGRVVVGFADGCTGTCVSSSSSTQKSAWATLARQTGGTGLFAAYP